MEQTSQQQLQSKADAMVACLEFIKLNMKSNSKFGRMANGKRKIKRWYLITHKIISFVVISSAFIFIIYIITL
jgi:hypothetical protein